MGNYYYTTLHDDVVAHNDNVVLLGPTEYLENGGQLYYSYAEWLIVRGFDALLSLSSGKQLTIGGNFSGSYNLEVYGYDVGTGFHNADCVNDAISAVKWSGTGKLYNAAETGAYLENRALDSKISILVKNSFNTNDYYSSATGYHVPTANFSAYGYTATTLNVLGNAKGNIAVFASEADGRRFTYTGSDGKPVSVDACNSSTGIAAAYNVTDLIFENIFDQNISAEASNNTFTTGVANSITGLTFKAYGVLATGSVSAANGDFSGDIKAVVSGNRFNAEYDNLPQKEGGGWSDISANISGNTLSAIGISAASLTVNTINTSIFSSLTNTDFEASAIGGEKGAQYATVGNNELLAAGIMVSGTLTVNQAFDADIFVENSYHNIVIFQLPEPQTEHLNSLNSYGVKAGTINSITGFGGTITVEQLENYNENSHYFEVDYCAGIVADSLNVSDGYIYSNISVVNDEDSKRIVEMANVAFGIKATTINSLGYFGSIDVSDNYSRACGISVSNLTNAYDDMFDIAGDIYSNGEALAVFNVLNLRISGYLVGDVVSQAGGTSDNDYVEIAAGAVIKGDINLKAGQNKIVVDSNARINGDLASELGKINIEFVLNDNAIYSARELSLIYRDCGVNSDAIIKTVGDDTSLQSVATISINLNDAKEGREYTLFECSSVDIDKWEQREIAVTYQGLNGHFRLDESEYTMSDGSNTATVELRINAGKVILTVKELVTSNVVPVEIPQNLNQEYSAETNTLAVSWTSESNIELYELEYRLNGSKSLTVVMDRDKINQLTSDGILTFEFGNIKATDTLEWRVRAHKAEGSIYSDWTRSFFLNTGVEDLQDIPGEIINAKASNDEAEGLTSSVATLTWDAAACAAGLDHYEIRYYQDLDEDSSWENTAGKTILTKYASSNELIVTGFSNQQFVHWQVRAVDVNGQAGEWCDGELFRVFVGDTGAPTLDPEGVEAPEYSNWRYTYSHEAGLDSFKDITLTWEPAVDTDNKSQVGGYVLSYRNIKETDSDWVVLYLDNNTINIGGKAMMQKTITVKNGANFEYEWKIQAYDFAGNHSTAYTAGGNWLSDAIAPELLSVSSEQIVNERYNGVEIHLNWDAEDRGAVVSGIQKYVIRFDAASKLAPVTLNPNKDSYVLKSWEKNLANGSYSWQIEVYDNAGNVYVSDEKIFKVVKDFDPPVFPQEENLNAEFEVSEDQTCEITFSWAAAVDTGSGVAKYVVSYILEDGTIKTFEVPAVEGSEIQTVTKTASELGLTVNKTQSFSWYVTAYDFIGNEATSKTTAEFTVSNDNVAPVFRYGPGLDSETVSDNRGGCDVYFAWNPANEIEGLENVDQTGLSRYILCFNDASGQTQEITVEADLFTSIYSRDYTLPDGNYEWWIIAEDAAGNQTVSERSTFLVDTQAPTGTISSLAEPEITVVGGTTGGDFIFGGAVGNMDLLSSVSVKFTCDSNHTDTLSSVQYYWEFSSNSSFTDDSTFYFITDLPEITFDNSNLYSAGLFLNMNNIHWRVQACDDAGNLTEIWNVGKTFQFNDPDSNLKIEDTGVPSYVSAISIFEVRSINTDEYGLIFTWTPATDVFGVKEYQLVLQDANGRKYTYVTDGKESYEIQDLEPDEVVYDSQFLLTELTQGVYSCQITAIDYSGKSGETFYLDEQLTYDYTDPVFDVSNITVEHLANDLHVSWISGTDNIDIASYEISYAVYQTVDGVEIVKSETSVTVDGSSNEFWLRNIYDGHYGIRMRATDVGGNTSEWTDEVKYMLTNQDVSNTVGNAKDMNWSTLIVNEIGTASDPADYYHFNTVEAGYMKIVIGGVAALGSASGGINVTVYDESMNILRSFNVVSGDWEESVYLAVPGDVFVKVSAINPAVYTKYSFGAFGGTGESVMVYHNQTLLNSGSSLSGMNLNENNVMYVRDGGVVTDTLVGTGATVRTSSGGALNTTTVMRNGNVYISSGAKAVNTVLSGYLEVQNGAGASSTTVEMFGKLHVNSGGFISNTAVNTLGEVVLSGGAAAEHTTINSEGSLHIYSGAAAADTVVNEGGYLGIGGGAAAFDTEIGYHGTVTVWSGGTVNDNTINEWGTIILSSGAVANETIINTNGGLHVYAGAVANSTTVCEGGFFGVGYGAETNYTTIDSKGSLTVWGGGIVNDNTINEWGAIILSSGAVANRTTINANGGFHVFAGAVALNTEISSGARLGIGGGGTLYSTDQEHGATVVFYEGAKLSGWNDFEGVVLTSGSVNARDAFINFELEDRAAGETAVIDDLGNFNGVKRYSVEVAENGQADGVYRLAGGAEDFSGGLTLYVGDGKDRGTLLLDSTLIYDGKSYSLYRESGTLALRIS